MRMVRLVLILFLMLLASCGDIADYLTQDFLPPDTPTGLSGTAISSTKIDLSWSAASDNRAVVYYMLYRQGVHFISPSETYYSDIGLSPASTYCYMVRAVDESGNKSEKSAPVCITTLAAGNVDVTPPSVPGDFLAFMNSSSQIDLAWTNSTDNVGVQGYEIHRSFSFGGVYTFLNYALTNSYANIGLTNATEYCYKCLALDAKGNKSGFSNSACATTAP